MQLISICSRLNTGSRTGQARLAVAGLDARDLANLSKWQGLSPATWLAHGHKCVADFLKCAQQDLPYRHKLARIKSRHSQMTCAHGTLLVSSGQLCPLVCSLSSETASELTPVNPTSASKLHSDERPTALARTSNAWAAASSESKVPRCSRRDSSTVIRHCHLNWREIFDRNA